MISSNNLTPLQKKIITALQNDFINVNNVRRVTIQAIYQLLPDESEESIRNAIATFPGVIMDTQNLTGIVEFPKEYFT
jgi:hypothetical protein